MLVLVAKNLISWGQTEVGSSGEKTQQRKGNEEDKKPEGNMFSVPGEVSHRGGCRDVTGQHPGIVEAVEHINVYLK